jgi:hypothetical protein
MYIVEKKELEEIVGTKTKFNTLKEAKEFFNKVRKDYEQYTIEKPNEFGLAYFVIENGKFDIRVICYNPDNWEYRLMLYKEVK